MKVLHLHSECGSEATFILGPLRKGCFHAAIVVKRYDRGQIGIFPVPFFLRDGALPVDSDVSVWLRVLLRFARQRFHTMTEWPEPVARGYCEVGQRCDSEGAREEFSRMCDVKPRSQTETNYLAMALCVMKKRGVLGSNFQWGEAAAEFERLTGQKTTTETFERRALRWEKKNMQAGTPDI